MWFVIIIIIIIILKEYYAPIGFELKFIHLRCSICHSMTKSGQWIIPFNPKVTSNLWWKIVENFCQYHFSKEMGGNFYSKPYSLGVILRRRYALHNDDDDLDFTEYTSFDSPFHAPHL